MRAFRLSHLLRNAAYAVALALAACAPAGPRAVRYGADACGYCRMTVTDRRFGGQVATARGKLEAFDAAECLADYVNAAVADGATAAEPRAWVADFQHPGAWIPADSARFVRLARVGSPMGAGLAALRADASPAGLAIDGRAMTWGEVRAARRTARPTQVAGSAQHGAPQVASSAALLGAAGAAHAD